MKLNRAPFSTPDRYSLLTLSPTGCVMSAIKKAEDRDALILRLFNPSESVSCDASLSWNQALKGCCETDLKEQVLAGRGEEKGITGLFRPGQSRTFSLKTER